MAVIDFSENLHASFAASAWKAMGIMAKMIGDNQRAFCRALSKTNLLGLRRDFEAYLHEIAPAEVQYKTCFSRLTSRIFRALQGLVRVWTF